MTQFSRMKPLIVLLVAFALVGCSSKPDSAENTPPPSPTLQPTDTLMPETPFRVVAYVTSAVVPEVIPYDKLTHINYSFLIPNADGTFVTLPNAWKLDKIIDEAHVAGVAVLISVGGWGWDAEFEALAADPATRAVFIDNLKAFVEEHDLDGADIDWEYPDPGISAENFLLLIDELRTAMPDKLLTTAVVNDGPTASGIDAHTFPLLDFINVMAYEGHDHGTMAQFDNGIKYWRERGVPPEKLIIGVPFYAEPSGAPYRKLVEADPGLAQTDSAEWNGQTVHFNGIPTIQEKTQIALESAGGIMFWTLEHDTLDDLSLLKAIDETINK